MGFHRYSANEGGRIPAPSRAGLGLAANVLIKEYTTETDETITMAELSGGLIQQQTTLTSDVVYTLPTSLLIEAEWPEMDVGDAYTFMVTNAQAGAFDVVINDGAGTTAIGTNNTLSVPPQSTRMFTLVKTSTTTHDLY